MADVSNVKSACLQIIPEMFSFFLLVELYDVTEGGVWLLSVREAPPPAVYEGQPIRTKS